MNLVEFIKTYIDSAQPNRAAVESFIAYLDAYGPVSVATDVGASVYYWENTATGYNKVSGRDASKITAPNVR